MDHRLTVARTPTVSFTVAGVASTDVARQLASRGLFLSHGDFYAATVVERLGLGEEGLVRAGCACYSTAEEVERLIEAVKHAKLKSKVQSPKSNVHARQEVQSSSFSLPFQRYNSEVLNSECCDVSRTLDFGPWTLTLDFDDYLTALMKSANSPYAVL